MLGYRAVLGVYNTGDKSDLVLPITYSLLGRPKLFLFFVLLAAVICFILLDTFVASNSVGF